MPKRFSSIKKAISYCGLCGAEKSSANTVQRTPLSTAAEQAFTDDLDRSGKDGAAQQPGAGMLYDKEKQKGNANRATLAVARSWWPTSWRSTVAAEFSGGGDELHRCVERGGETRRVSSARRLQVLPLSRLGEGAQALDAPVD